MQPPNPADELLRQILERLTSMEARLTGVESRLTGIDARLSNVETNVSDHRRETRQGFSLVRDDIALLRDHWSQGFRRGTETNEAIADLYQRVKRLEDLTGVKGR